MSQILPTSQTIQTNSLEPSTPGAPTSTPGAPLSTPGAPGGSGGPAPSSLDIPVLPLPPLSTLSLEQLVEAISGEGQRLALQQGLQAIQAKGKEIDELNAQKMEELKKNLEQLQKKEKLSPFLKAFKWIGMVLGAIASVATVVAGALTGNPLLIAGGIIGVTMMVNSIVSEATDGKHGISAWVAEIAKKCGASETVAKWIGFAFEMAITLTGAVLSAVGAYKAFGSLATKAAELSAATLTATKWATGISGATTVLSGINSVAQGSVQIVAAVYDYRIDMAKAELQDLQGILEKILAAMKSDEDIVEAIMEKTQDLFGKVKEIVKDNVTAQTAILTGSSPGMA